MLVLNLANPEKSDIKYTLIKYPDGQQSLTITSAPAAALAGKVRIITRMNSFRDLEPLICATQDLYDMGAVDIELYAPYFLGCRSDRKFEYGSTNYLKNVICPIINSQGYSKVIVMDAHSDVLEACINHYHKIDNSAVVQFALEHIGSKDNQIIVAPDGGALKKIYDVAKHFGIDRVVTAGKVRDIKTGAVVKTEVPDITMYDGFEFLIVDDICDGGRTFIELAKAIHLQLPKAKVRLCVTHGIFSAGFRSLNEHLDAIICTNSYVDMNNPEFSLANDNKMYKLHQLAII